MGFLFGGGFLVALVLGIFEGKMNIVWKEGAAQLYRGSTNFFPMKLMKLLFILVISAYH